MAQDVAKLFSSLQNAVDVASKKQAARDAAQSAFTAASEDFQKSAEHVDALRSELKDVLDTLLPNSNPRVKVSG